VDLRDFRGKAAIVGVAESVLGEAHDETIWSMQAKAAAEALDDAGIRLDEVDAVFCASGGQAYSASMQLAEYLGIVPSYTDSTNIGGSSFEAHLGHALLGIASGACEVALICYASRQRSERSRRLAPGGLAPAQIAQTLMGQFEAPYGLPMPLGAYALAAQRHMAVFGTTPEQLARIAVDTRLWASKNPKAWFRDPITIDDVLESPMIASPLHLLDCCLVTDGGGALVVTGVDRAADCKKQPVYILGWGESHDHAMISQMPDLTSTSASRSSSRAFEMAGLGPGDIDVLELYDSFTITVLLALEDLGYCAKGEGGPFVEDGKLGPGGSLPTNTSGGGLSYCHPGMFGIFLLIEAVRQLRGECGERQVVGASTALAHGCGGVLSSTATAVLSNTL
jgi:acetyl-CoA acetyltransferase